MKVSQKQLEAVVALPGPERHRHFVKKVADSQEVWGLFQNGWALAAADDGTTVFPLWPAREYAELCAAREWTGFAPRAIGLDELMSELLPKLKHDGVLPGIFFTPANRGVTPSVDELKAALDAELQNY